MSLWVALLFVAHPIQTQAVTYMVQRYASMSALFYMVSVLMFIQARKLQLKARKPGQNEASENHSTPLATPSAHSFFPPKILICFAFCGISGALAFLSKENAATLPGILLMVEYFLFDRSWQGWKKKLIWIIPLGVLLVFLALYFLSVSRGFKFENLLEDVSVITRETQKVSAWRYLCTQFSVLVQYIRLLFFPVGQNIDHMYLFKAGFFDGLTPLAFAFIMAVISLGIWNIRKRAAISFGIFWFFITLSIESSIFPISDAMFEHRLYLPVFGFSVSIVYMIFQLFSRREKWTNFLLMSAVVILGLGTFQRNNVWQDPFLLWADSARKNPNNHRAHNNLGAELNDRGQPMRAMREYSRSLEIKPDFADANNNVGNILIRQGQYEEATRYLSKALKKKPRLVGAQNNMGVALASMGDFDGAIRHIDKAIRLKPRYAEAHNSMGNALAQKGLSKEAMKSWARAVELDPRYAEPRFNMGVMFELQGDVEEAKRCFSDAIRIKPNYAQAYSKLGFISAREGKYKAAMKLFSEALRINPRLPDARKGFQEMIRITGRKN
jgi:protein O-mannosyl-transferase